MRYTFYENGGCGKMKIQANGLIQYMLWEMTVESQPVVANKKKKDKKYCARRTVTALKEFNNAHTT